MVIAISADAQRRYYGPRGRRVAQQRVQRNTDNFYQPKFGLKVGANISNSVSRYDSYNTGSLVGLNIGLTADLPIIYPLSFAPEVLYSQKGYTVGTNYGNFTQRTHFIDVPLLAKIKVAPAFNVLVGPQLSWLLSTTNTYDDGFLVTQRSTYDNRNNGHKTYLDGVIGVSFDINRNVDIHGRYAINLQGTDRYGNTYAPDYRNQVWQVGLGFKF